MPTLPASEPETTEKPALKGEVVAEIPSDGIDLELWEQGRKIAGEVQACDWLDYREAARRFWLAHVNHLQSIGDVQAATSARFRRFAIWPEGELESRMVPSQGQNALTPRIRRCHMPAQKPTRPEWRCHQSQHPVPWQTRVVSV